jgi:Uridine kinase
MTPNIPIFCRNNQQEVLCPPGTTLAQLARLAELRPERPFLTAFVNHKLKDLSYEIYKPCNVCFVDLTHVDGLRTYVRSLSFLLQKAVHDLYPQKRMILDYTVANGLFGVFERDVAQRSEIEAISHRMKELIAANLPFIRYKKTIQEATEIFRAVGKEEKAVLLETRMSFYASVYYLEDYPDSYFGPLVPHTGLLQTFGLIPFHHGFLLQYPGPGEYDNIKPRIRQDKMFSVFQEHSEWCSIIGAKHIGDINALIQKDQAAGMIMVSEALHERKYAQIADQLYKRRQELRLALIAGPSSSGKTTTSKRLALHAQVVGLHPVVLELDNYFVNREQTPRDANGEHDFEALEALDLDFLNEQLTALFRGEEVALPTFNFAQGKREFLGNRMRLQEKDILIMEGIHALNPRLTEAVPSAHKYKIYASALTALSLDENNRVFTTDNRLLRRMVRDAQFRGTTAEETILRWPSVRRGEDANIFPFQEQADIMFNSTLLYELPVLRYFAEPLLRRIQPTSPAYPEAFRLLKFLHYIEFMMPKDFKYIPSVSVMREFIGSNGLV